MIDQRKVPSCIISVNKIQTFIVFLVKSASIKVMVNPTGKISLTKIQIVYDYWLSKPLK